MDRREFLSTILKAGVAYILLSSQKSEGIERRKGLVIKREAMNYRKKDKGEVECYNCPHHCYLKKGETGFCRVRKNEGGKLYTHVYSNPCALHIDPIEKKPFFHFLPGTLSFSIATAGCNLRCKYCQNWEISQYPPEETVNYRVYPKDIVEWALYEGTPTIAYTYSEPTIFFEYMYEISKEAKKAGIKNIYHSNGFISQRSLKKLIPYLSAANIDLKTFRDSKYREMSMGRLEPVLETLKTLKNNNVHLEITYLVVPEWNDGDDEIRDMLKWVKENLGPEQVIHFSRFYPMYRLKNLYPTPVKTLERIWKLSRKMGMPYTYIGNVPGHKAEHTYCPSCGKAVIKRRGFKILELNMKNGKCKYCGYKIKGVWK